MKKVKTLAKSKIRKAFTLVEVLAATSIMVVVVLLVLSLTGNVLTSWNQASGQLATNFEARIALDILSKDLESAFMRRNDKCWFEVKYESITGLSDPQPRLAFFAPVLDRPSKRRVGDDWEVIDGDLCAIQYRLIHQNPFEDGGDIEVYGLYRVVIDAESTFNVPLSYVPPVGSGNPAYLLSSNGGVSAFWDNDSFNGVTVEYVDQNGTKRGGDNSDDEAEMTAWAAEGSNFLGANIVDIDLTFYYEDLITGDPTPIPVGTDFYFNDGVRFGSSVDGDLLYVDVTMTILSEEGARIVQNLDKNASIKLEDVIVQYSKTFSRRINIMSRPF